MNILDFVLIAIFIACVINSYYKGFFKEILGIVSFILSIVFFYILYPIVNNWLLKSIFLKKVKDWVIHDLNLVDFVTTTQEDVIATIQTLNVPQIIKDVLIKNNNEVYYKIFNVNSVVEYIANFIAIIIISLITVFVLIVVVSIVMRIVFKKINILCKLPVLGKFDKIGGIIIGIVKGLFTLWIVCIIILILSIFPQLSFLKDQFDGFLTEPLIRDNILSKLLLKLILGIIS